MDGWMMETRIGLKRNERMNVARDGRKKEWMGGWVKGD